MHHTASPVYSIFVDILLLQTHTHTHITIQPWHTKSSHTCVHTQTSTTTVTSHPALVFITILLILSLCVQFQKWFAFDAYELGCKGTGKLDRWFSIFLLILLTVCCVCTCNSIVCVLDIFDKCENEGLAAHIGQPAAVTRFLFILSLLTIRVGLPLLWTFSLTGAV